MSFWGVRPIAGARQAQGRNRHKLGGGAGKEVRRVGSCPAQFSLGLCPPLPKTDTGDYVAESRKPRAGVVMVAVLATGGGGANALSVALLR